MKDIVVVDSIRNRIYTAMKIRNMRQVDLINKTGIPKSTMSQYLSGATEPKSDRIYTISKALDVSETWLMGLDVPMDRQDLKKVNTDAVADFVIDYQEFSILIETYKKLDDSSKKMILDLAKKLSDK